VRISFCHGSPINIEEFEYIFSTEQAARCLDIWDDLATVTFIGHSHLCKAFALTQEEVYEVVAPKFVIRPDHKYIISVGSVGWLGCGEGGPAADAGLAPPPSGNLDLDDCFADLVAPNDHGFIEVQSFETHDGAIRIRRARKPGDRNAVGETFAYDLIRFGIASDDDVYCESRQSRLSYAFGHHNWDEVYEAQTEIARYRVQERFLFDGATSWEDTVEALALDGTRSWGPLTLNETGCYSLPYNFNPCMQRMRTDRPPAGEEE
jgi:hypothetical protein